MSVPDGRNGVLRLLTAPRDWCPEPPNRIPPLENSQAVPDRTVVPISPLGVGLYFRPEQGEPDPARLLSGLPGAPRAWVPSRCLRAERPPDEIDYGAIARLFAPYMVSELWGGRYEEWLGYLRGDIMTFRANQATKAVVRVAQGPRVVESVPNPLVRRQDDIETLLPLFSRAMTGFLLCVYAVAPPSPGQEPSSQFLGRALGAFRRKPGLLGHLALNQLGLQPLSTWQCPLTPPQQCQCSVFHELRDLDL